MGEAGAAVTVTVSLAAGSVPFAVLTMLAVAVRVTELTEVAPAGTGIWASRLTGLVSVTELTVHVTLVAVLDVLAHPLVNAGCWLDGAEVRATDTSAAEPFWVDTVTTNAALCPRAMLACVRWTLTQSSGWAALDAGLVGAELVGAGLVDAELVDAGLVDAGLVDAGLALAPAVELAGAVAWGLAAMKALSEAETVADPEGDPEGDPEADPEGDPEADPGDEGEADEEGEPDPDGEPEADTEPVPVPVREGWGVLVTGSDDADVLAAVLAEGDGDADGEGRMVGLGVGDGVGDGVLDDDGSSWHVVSVFGDVLELGVAETAISKPALALPGQIASPPRISRPPASKLSIIARTCAKRI